MSETRTITSTLPIEMTQRIDAWAETSDSKRSWLVREAFDAVDAGQIIPHSAMVIWAASLVTDNPLPPPEPQKCHFPTDT